MNNMLLYIGGALPIIWGIGHLIPTRNVLKDFGEISRDNQNILLMEWINEGAILIFLGILTILTTAVGKSRDLMMLVYWSVITMLLVLSVISLFTGFKVDFLPYKLCTVIFTASAILIILGMYT